MNEFIQLRLLIHWRPSALLTCSRVTLTEFHFKISLFKKTPKNSPGEYMRALVSVITHLILSSTSLCLYRKQVVTPHTSRFSAESWMKEKRTWMWSEERRLLPGNPVECVLGSEGTKHWSYDNSVREAASCGRISDNADFSYFKGQ